MAVQRGGRVNREVHNETQAAACIQHMCTSDARSHTWAEAHTTGTLLWEASGEKELVWYMSAISGLKSRSVFDLTPEQKAKFFLP